MGKQSNVEAAQRRETVLSLVREEDTAAAIARRDQVSEPTLDRWRDEFLAGGEASFVFGTPRARCRARPDAELGRALPGQPALAPRHVALEVVRRR